MDDNERNKSSLSFSRTEKVIISFLLLFFSIIGGCTSYKSYILDNGSFRKDSKVVKPLIRAIPSLTKEGFKINKYHVYQVNDLNYFNDSNEVLRYFEMVLKNEGEMLRTDFKSSFSKSLNDTAGYVIYSKHGVRDGSKTLIYDKKYNRIFWQQYSGQFSPHYLFPNDK